MIKEIHKYNTSVAIQMTAKKHEPNNRSWVASAYDNKYNHMGDVGSVSLRSVSEEPSAKEREELFNYLYESCCLEHPTADHIIIEQIPTAKEKGE